MAAFVASPHRRGHTVKTAESSGYALSLYTPEYAHLASMTTIANGAKPLAWQASTMPSQIARACCSDNRLMACDASGRKVEGTLSGESNTLLAGQRSQLGPLLMGRGWTSLELCSSTICMLACMWLSPLRPSPCGQGEGFRRLRLTDRLTNPNRAAAYYIIHYYDSENPHMPCRMSDCG